MEIQKLVGLNIRKHRLNAGISQEEFAARMNVDQAYVSRLEAGQRNPTIKTIGEAASALCVEPAQLFERPGK
ncbi:helix-turn-helix transcriptional regulator [Mesorhizobium sp. B2-4-14]|uniref:helix-turn-helix domain-containing protein n=1 Tax=Mesorhizobium sp. B2-4-14 TaxID=2589935 RepID=UPI00112C2CA0|nr:helix-turn-helix transcriptional regulator [Mesorhizobium sp. B2-4-14]TPL00488.1 helix-turn-helix transcriptional regulator [Mesorhizobium sp. B2-4-14]